MSHTLYRLSLLPLALASQAWGVDYTTPVNSQNVTLSAGDTITVNGGSQPALRAPAGSPAINISNGGIQITGTNVTTDLVELGNNQTNNFGSGSSIVLTPATENIVVMRLNSSALIADNMTFSGGAIYLNTSSLTLTNSSISSSNRYAITSTTGGAVVNLKDTEITHTVNSNGSRTINELVGQSLNLENVTINSTAESVIDVDRGTIPVSLKNLNISHNTSSTLSTARAIWIYGNSTLTGSDISIDSNRTSLYLQGADATITGTNKLLSSSGAALVGSLHSNNTYQTRLTLSGADIQSANSAAVYFDGASSQATISDSVMTGAYAAYASNGATINLSNSQLYSQNNGQPQTYALGAIAGGVLNLSQSNSLSSSGNSIAMLASNAGQINVSGRLTSDGIIAAQNNSTINFDLIQSGVSTAFSKDASSSIHWQASDSTLSLTDNSALTSMSLGENAQVDMNSISAYVLLELDDLFSTTNSNWPTFTMKANVQTNQADQLKVSNSSSGDFWVDVPNDASQANDGLQILPIIETADAQATFTSTKKIELGGYYYTVARNGSNTGIWQLEPTVGPPPEPVDPEPTPPDPLDPPPKPIDPPVPSEPEISASGRGGANIAVASHLMNYASQQSLIERLSVARINPTERGTWTRVHHGKIDLKTDRIRGSDLSYTGLQLGYDQVFYSTPESYWLAGSMLEYVKGKQHYEDGENRLSAYSAALYLSHFYDHGLYFDGFLKYSALRNSVSTTDTENTAVKGHDNTHGLTLSAEVGKTWQFAKNAYGEFFVQPQIQLSVSKIDEHRFKNSNGLEVKAQAEKSVLGRAGINLGYQFAAHPTSVYLKFDALKEFDGDIDFTLNGNPEHLKIQNNWLEFGFGAQTAIGQRQKLFVEAKGSNNSQFKEKKINLGYRWNF